MPLGLLVEVAFLPPSETPTAGDWVDFTSRAESCLINISRGRERASDPDFSPGTLTGLRLESTNRDLDPLNEDSPYHPDIKPNRWLRISAVYNSVTYRRFTGFIDSWEQHYESKHYATVHVSATDYFRRLAKRPIVRPYFVIGESRVGIDLIGPPPPAEKSGDRVTRILDDAGITNYEVSTGSSTIPEGMVEQTSVLDYLQKVARTENGRLFISANGTITFRGRHDPVLLPVMRDSQGSFGERGVADHFVADVEFAPHIAELFNRIVVNMPNGVQAIASDQDSIDEFDEREMTRDVLLSSRVAGQRIADHLLTRHKDPVPRLSRVVIEPDADPDDLFPAVLARDLGDRITVVGTPQGTGTPINQEAHIEQIVDEIDTHRTLWKTTWGLSAADLTNYLVIGEGRVGVDRVAA